MLCLTKCHRKRNQLCYNKHYKINKVSKENITNNNHRVILMICMHNKAMVKICMVNKKCLMPKVARYI